MPVAGQIEDPEKIYKLFTHFVGDLSSDTGQSRGECFLCGRPKLYVNLKTGQWDCKVCNASGNKFGLIRHYYAAAFEATTPEHFRQLREKRGIAPQTLKRWGLAYDSQRDEWLLPFKNLNGDVVNLQRYQPNSTNGPNKFNLPGFRSVLFGLDRLRKDLSKMLYLCEGPFDAIALDYALGDKHRMRYSILAQPGSGFKKEWCQYLAKRRVALLFDNDAGGKTHIEKIKTRIKENKTSCRLSVLHWPADLPDGYDLNDLVRDLGDKRGSIARKLQGWCEKSSDTKNLRFVAMDDWLRKGDRRQIEWFWPHRIPCGTYASLAGQGGTSKSTAMRDIVARYTGGDLLPDGNRAAIPISPVLYVSAEDHVDRVMESLELLEADPAMVRVLGLDTDQNDFEYSLNLLSELDALEEEVRRLGCRLVVIDGQNSVLGAPDISSDMKARCNLSNKLHRFAQRTGTAVIGIRNCDRDGRAYGPASMGDISRCVMEMEIIEVEQKQKDGEPKTMKLNQLRFAKVSDANPKLHQPLRFKIEDRGGNLRRPVWMGGVRPWLRSESEVFVQSLMNKNEAKNHPQKPPRKRLLGLGGSPAVENH